MIVCPDKKKTQTGIDPDKDLSNKNADNEINNSSFDDIPDKLIGDDRIIDEAASSNEPDIDSSNESLGY